MKGTITITRAGDNDNAERAEERDKEVILKDCTAFIDFISKINNTQADNAKDLNVVMPMYILIEYIDKYLKTSESLWWYYRDMPGEAKNAAITDSESFKSKVKVTGITHADVNRKNVETAVPLKYFSNFWRTLEMPLTNCEIKLILTWPEDFVISAANRASKFAITDTKIYVPVVTFSANVNTKLLQQLKSSFKRAIN